jgi:hypothetical protein
LHNRGGNKLDPFIGVHNTIRTTRVADGTDVSVTVSIANATPRGLPQYVSGPYPGSVGGARNVYQGILTLYVPGSAPGIQVVRTQGHDPVHIVAAGTDGPSRVVGVQVKLAPGEFDHMRFTFRVPKQVDRLVVEPSARVNTLQWELDRIPWLKVRWEDVEARTVGLR